MEKITKYIKKLLPVLLVAVIITTYFSLNIVAYYVNTASGSYTAYPAKFDFTVIFQPKPKRRQSMLHKALAAGDYTTGIDAVMANQAVHYIEYGEKVIHSA